MYDLSKLKNDVKEAHTWLLSEFDGIRTGRASPAILDSIRVDAYGTKMPIKEIASISVEDARTLRISPWDRETIRPLESAIRDADLGISAATDEKGIRISFPELTSERRAQLMKVMKEKLEQARIGVRKARDDSWNAIQKDEKDGAIGEDDKFRAKDEMQKIVDEANAGLEAAAKKKEVELSQ